MLKACVVALVLAAIGFTMNQVGQPFNGGCGIAVCTGGVWKNLPLDAGGLVTQVVISADGKMFARSDSAGPWLKTAHANPWTPAFTGTSTPTSPSNFLYPSSMQASCGVAISPTNTSTVYSLSGAGAQSGFAPPFFKSTNFGASWTYISGNTLLAGEGCIGNGGARYINPHVAVGPVQVSGADVVYVGTQLGMVYFSLDGGTTWHDLTAAEGFLPGVPQTPSAADTTTSQSVGTGSRTWTGMSYFLGGCGIDTYVNSTVQVYETANPNNTNVGIVTACSGASLTVNVIEAYGSFTGTGWRVAGPFSQQASASTAGVVAFDPSDATGGTVYIFSYGVGLYKCTGAKTTTPSCALQNGSGAPTTMSAMAIAPDGVVWVVDDSKGPGAGVLLRDISGTWTTQVTALKGSAIAINPSNSLAVYYFDNAGCLEFALNAESSPPTWNAPAGACGAIPPTSFSYTGTTNTVWTFADDANLDVVSAAFDPTQSNIIYVGTGVGVFFTTAPTSNGSVAPVYSTNEGVGINNLDSNVIHFTTTGKMLYAVQDRMGWIVTPGVFPTQYYPTNRGPTAQVLGERTTICGDSSGTNLMLMADNSLGFIMSNNAGSSWGPAGNNAWTADHSGNYGQCVWGSGSKVIWVASQNVGPYGASNASNGSATWTACGFANDLSGHAVTAGGGGWDNTQVVITYITLAQDSVTPTTVLLYSNASNLSTNQSSMRGIWKNTTGTCSGSNDFTQVYQEPTSPIIGGTSMQLKAVPGQSCNFFSSPIAFPLPPGSLPTSSSIYFSQNCGTSWSTVDSTRVKSAIGWALGAPKPGGDGYPAFYCVCYVDPTGGGTFTYGVWESDNIDVTFTGGHATWTNIDAADNGFPAGNIDALYTMDADPLTYGIVTACFGGSGCSYWTHN